MFAATALYNKASGATSVRIGNWVEEKALKKYNTSDSKFRGATYERCIAHKDTQDYRKLKSLNTETFSRSALVGSVPSQVGPRASARDRALMERARKETEEAKFEPRCTRQSSAESSAEKAVSFLCIQHSSQSANA